LKRIRRKRGEEQLHLFKYLVLIAAILGVVSLDAHAHPVTYKGNTNFMVFNSPSMQDLWLGYTFHRNAGVTLRGIRSVQSDHLGGEREFLFPQLNFLVKRWNEVGSQANIYLFAGYGFEHKRDPQPSQNTLDGALIAALEADWESRKYYISGKYQLIRLTDKPGLDSEHLRLGVAPYLSEYDQLGAWFIVQAKRMENSFSKLEVTPLLRFYYHNVLWEIGMSLRGKSLFNFMVHF